MYEITASVFVGTNLCNANCKHCAGKQITSDKIDDNLIYDFLLKRYDDGARYLTISSAGEPTLFPKDITNILDISNSLGNKKYERINLYSNGIIIGENNSYSKKYFPIWKSLGLTHFYITVHDLNMTKNAEIYRVKDYPSLDKVILPIHEYGLLVRANLIITKSFNINKYIDYVNNLKNIGFDEIVSWPLRKKDDTVDTDNLPEDYNLILEYIAKSKTYKPKDRLTMFSNNKISRSWCS